MMKLLRFHVTNFRSVEDSGWIDVDNVTALIGTNESGKTNLLLPLWKLNPAKDGEINAITDYPRKRYNEIRSMDIKPIFIEADFEVSDDLATEIAEISEVPKSYVSSVNIKRDFNGKYFITFPNATITDSIAKGEITKLLSSTHTTIKQSKADTANPGLKQGFLASLTAVQDFIGSLSQETLDADHLKDIRKQLEIIKTEEQTPTEEASRMITHYTQAVSELDAKIAFVSKPLPGEVEAVQQAVLTNLPSFVYYSNYGNLDSEIYLPHVIQNMQRNDLGSREEAKARTLKVLFEFVKLKPEEIYQLGQEHDLRNIPDPSQQQIQEFAEKKKEREILLQSASTELTKKFRSWWKQGDYRSVFRQMVIFFVSGCQMIGDLKR